ncbi:MAG: PilZ domain-containing protein [Leptospirales bacterium]|nr:PilZ domain-containing protein [Leptospirales bacterium]
MEQRIQPRRSGRSLELFRVDVEWENRRFAGFPRNISDSGASLCLPGSNALHIPSGAMLRGQMSVGNTPVHFQGNVVWTRREERHGRPALLLGLQFDSELSLPDAVLSASAPDAGFLRDAK